MVNWRVLSLDFILIVLIFSVVIVFQPEKNEISVDYGVRDINHLTILDIAQNESERKVIEEISQGLTTDYSSAWPKFYIQGIDGFRFNFLNITGEYEALKV